VLLANLQHFCNNNIIILNYYYFIPGLFPSHSWWAESCSVRLSRGMVCSRQPRSFQGVHPHGRPDGWTEEGWRDGWRDARVQGRLHFSSRRPLMYRIFWAWADKGEPAPTLVPSLFWVRPLIASPPVLSLWLQTVKFIGRKSQCAGLALEIVFSAPNSCSLPWLVKGATQLCTSKKECNKLDVTATQYWSRRFAINSSHGYAVPVTVLLVGLLKQKNS